MSIGGKKGGRLRNEPCCLAEFLAREYDCNHPECHQQPGGLNLLILAFLALHLFPKISHLFTCETLKLLFLPQRIALSGPPDAEQTMLAKTLCACTHLWCIHLSINSFIYREFVVLVAKGTLPRKILPLDLLALKTTCEQSDGNQKARSADRGKPLPEEIGEPKENGEPGPQYTMSTVVGVGDAMMLVCEQ